MATTKDRYILEVDTKTATAAIDKLKAAINGLGAGSAGAGLENLKRQLSGVRTTAAVREIAALKSKMSELNGINVDKKIREIGSASQAASGGMRALAAAATAAVAAFALNKIIDVTARFEDLRSSLDTVTGSAKAGGDAFKFIKDFASQTQFGVEELTKTYIQLKTAGIEPTTRLLKIFADTASVTTDQVGSLEAMTALLARTAGGGLGIEELDRLAERGIPVFKILKEEMGLSRDEIGKFGQSAEGAAEIVNTLMDALERDFGGAAAGKLNNLSTIMSNFGDAVDRTVAAFGSGLAPALKEIVGDMTDFLNANEGLAKVLGEISGEVLRGLADSLKEIATSLNMTDAAGLKSMFADLIIGMGDFVTGFQTGIDTLLRGIAVLANSFAQLYSTINGTAILEPGTNNIEAYLESLKSMRDHLIAEQGVLDSLVGKLGDVTGIAGYTAALKTSGAEIAALDQQIAAIESGNYFVKMSQDISSSNSEADRLGERIRNIGENLKLNSEFPFYPDAIVRATEAQERMAAAAANAGAIVKSTGDAAAVTAQTFEKTASTEFYDSLIIKSQEASNATLMLQTSMAGLNEALAKGVITPQIYAQAMAELNRMYGEGQVGLAQYSLGMSTLGESVANTTARATQLKEKLDELTQAGADALASAEARIQSAQDQADLSGLTGLQRELQSITIEEQRLAAAAKERLQAQYGSTPELQAELQKQLAAIDAAASSATAARQDAARVIDANTEALRRQSEAAVLAGNNVSSATSGMVTQQRDLRTGILDTQAAFDQGWQNSFNNYQTQVADSSAYAQSMFNKTGQGLEDMLVNGIKTGKFEWKSFAAGLAEDILRNNLRKLFGGMGQPQVTDTTAPMPTMPTMPTVPTPNLGGVASAVPGAVSGMYDPVAAAAAIGEVMAPLLELGTIKLTEDFLNFSTTFDASIRSSNETITETIIQLGKMMDLTVKDNAALTQGAVKEFGLSAETAILKFASAASDAIANLSTTLQASIDSLGNAVAGAAQAAASAVPNIPSTSTGGGTAPASGGLWDTLSNIGGGIKNLFGGFFATGGQIPPGRFGMVGENGPEYISGPANITPMANTSVTYNINAVDAASFKQMIARDPEFIYAVTQKGSRSMPGVRK